jgi:hypothetical protein
MGYEGKKVLVVDDSAVMRHPLAGSVSMDKVVPILMQA